MQLSGAAPVIVETHTVQDGTDVSSRPLTRVVAAGSLFQDKKILRSFAPHENFVLIRSQGLVSAILADCRRLAPCVLLVDESTLGAAGAAECAMASDFGRCFQILVLGNDPPPEAAEAWLRAGCMGFVGRSVPAATLRKAVLTVASGEYWAERKLISRLLQDFLGVSSVRRLTPRENDVLRLIGAGLSNRAIADRLSISRETVRWHIRSLYAKLDVRDRQSAGLHARGHLHEQFGDRPGLATSLSRLSTSQEQRAPRTGASRPKFTPVE